jgi:imidazolonepropionase-like amidohydrolase
MRAFLLAVTALIAAGPAAAETVVVTADRMLDVAAGRYVERPQITVVDGRITAVGRQGAAVPAGARRVDLPGLTLLPGLIDMHVHLDGDPRFGGYRRFEYSDRFWPVIAAGNAQRTLERASRPFATWARAARARTWASSRRSTKAWRSALASSRPTTASARPAATATRPICRRPMPRPIR